MITLRHHGPKFDEGTIVRMKYIPSGCPPELISKFGVVVIPNKNGFFAVGVEFMEWDGGHSLGGRIASKAGWYVSATKIEATTYQRADTPGQTVILLEAA